MRWCDHQHIQTSFGASLLDHGMAVRCQCRLQHGIRGSLNVVQLRIHTLQSYCSQLASPQVDVLLVDRYPYETHLHKVKK